MALMSIACPSACDPLAWLPNSSSLVERRNDMAALLAMPPKADHYFSCSGEGQNLNPRRLTRKDTDCNPWTTNRPRQTSNQCFIMLHVSTTSPRKAEH
eukprot:6471705-Amphidinium_carterae.1